MANSQIADSNDRSEPEYWLNGYKKLLEEKEAQWLESGRQTFGGEVYYVAREVYPWIEKCVSFKEQLEAEKERSAKAEEQFRVHAARAYKNQTCIDNALVMLAAGDIEQARADLLRSKERG